MKPIIRYFSKVRQFTQLNPVTRATYLYEPHRTFVRQSPLTFSRTVGLISDLARQSLAVVLGRFFRWRPEEVVTKSAFCQRRQAIKPAFFRDLFLLTARHFYHCFPDYKRWKGKRLQAIDGTGLALPHYPHLGEVFGTHLNQHGARPSVRLLVRHDVLNNVINSVDLYNQNTAEITVAYPNVDELPTDSIYIYDRHYASFALAYLHDRAGSDYVIRMPVDGANIVKDLMQSDDNEHVVDVTLPVGRGHRSLKALNLERDRKRPFTVRLVKVPLDDGTTEVLMTSLTDRRRYPYRDFKWLYGKRWGVETAIFVLKSFLQIALTSAITQPGVEQDLWATFAFYNQQSALVKACEEEVERLTRHRSYEYRINRNVLAGILQHFLYDIYLHGSTSWRARTLVLLRLVPRYTEPYRPDRNRERERKLMRMNNRHIHEKNYRKAI